MKIRTSFVTNSSGSSFTEITIDNPVLVDIIRKYNSKFKKAGTSKMNMSNIIINNDKLFMSDSGHPSTCGDAIFWEGFDVVKNGNIGDSIIDSYLKNLKDEIKELNYNEEIKKIFNEVKKEINEKRELINNSFKTIEYHNNYSGDLGGCGSTKENIICDYDNKCPICGSLLLYDQYNSDFDYIDENGEYHSDISQIEDSIIIKCANDRCDYSREILSKNYLLKSDTNNDSYNPFEGFVSSDEISDDDLLF